MRIPQGARSVRTGGDKDGREDKARNQVESEGGSAQNLLRRGRAPKPGGEERAPETRGGSRQQEEPVGGWKAPALGRSCKKALEVEGGGVGEWGSLTGGRAVKVRRGGRAEAGGPLGP